jgi:hypothetical protein
METPDCAALWKLVAWRMPQENQSGSENDSREVQKPGLRERIDEIRAKTNQLSQTLAGVDKNLQQASDAKEGC